MEKCESDSIVCINCSGKHVCFSNFCDKYAQKKFQINSFTLKIILGEQLIEKESDILNRPSFLSSICVTQVENEYKQNNLKQTSGTHENQRENETDLIEKYAQLAVKENMSNFYTKCDNLE